MLGWLSDFLLRDYQCRFGGEHQCQARDAGRDWQRRSAWLDRLASLRHRFNDQSVNTICIAPRRLPCSIVASICWMSPSGWCSPLQSQQTPQQCSTSATHSRQIRLLHRCVTLKYTIGSACRRIVNRMCAPPSSSIGALL